MDGVVVFVCLERRAYVTYLVQVIRRVLPSWPVYFVHAQGEAQYWSANADYVTLIESADLMSVAFWSQFSRERVLVHGPDDVLCEKCPWPITDFRRYDYVGTDTLSLRNRAAMLDCLDKVAPRTAEQEGVYFARAMTELGYVVETRNDTRFVSTCDFTTKPLGASGAATLMNWSTFTRFLTYCPDARVMCDQVELEVPWQVEKLSKILYGVPGKYKNVTALALAKCVSHVKILTVPLGDANRSALFGDHLYGTLKHIVVVADGQERTFQHGDRLVLDVSCVVDAVDPVDMSNPIDRLESIHTSLHFEGGDVRDEYPEQLMVVRHVRPDDVVLEIGSNIGRNTLTIASLLTDSKQLVTVECDPSTCVQLQRNRDMNGMHFAIEPSALSKRKLIQRGWDTHVISDMDAVPQGYKAVSTLSVADFKAKYAPLAFSVLVADCEGALYYILQDEPHLLEGLRCVIMENDYKVLEHKHAVDGILLHAGFVRVHFESGGWGPCKAVFFEVWERHGTTTTQAVIQ